MDETALPEPQSQFHLPDSFILPDLVPANILSEFAYCPRLAYLKWVQCESEETADLLEGRLAHQRVDQEKGTIPEAEDGGEEPIEKIHATSVMLSGPEIGIISRIDLLESDGGLVQPVEYKKGKAPDIPELAYEPERMQVCAQALILRENGYGCEKAIIYYAGSRRRVEIPVTQELIARCQQLLAEMKQVALAGKIPPPLTDSPKCPRCSLVSICLPDETNLITHVVEGEIRRLVPSRDDAMPLAIQQQGAYLGKKGEVLQVRAEGQVVTEARLMDVSQVMLYGGVQVSTQCLQELLGRGIPVLYFSQGSWFYGMTTGLGHKNIERRITQFHAFEDPSRSLRTARQLVRDKASNSRTLLRRNIPDCPEEPLTALKREIERIEACTDFETLLGHEGNVARIYFEHFGKMLKTRESGIEAFDFSTRNRRPPKDPVNAMLSFTYSLLVKDFTIALAAVGFDPYLGFYHRPRYGRPALALDMMEPFRPLIADSAVIWCINNGVVTPQGFSRVGSACSMSSETRKKVILAYERRMDSLITHPVFDYRISYRRVLEVQARLLARYLEGELSDPPSFVTR